jgi:hypothetical protein
MIMEQKDNTKQDNITVIQRVNDEKEESRIEFIKSRGTTNWRWVNGKSGYFEDFDNNCLYRFCEMDKEGCNFLQKAQERKNSPILACGFVAWLIKHWGMDTATIYSGYLQARLKQYKDEHKRDADVFERDLEQEFYEQHRAEEEQWVKLSEGIFDFISDSEVNQIKKYVKYYFEYVCSQSKTVENSFSQLEATEHIKTDTNIDKSQQYSSDLAKIEEIYDFCVRSKIIDNNIISSVDFVNAVNQADFRTIHDYAEENGAKSKCKYIIYIISFSFKGSDWYLKTAHSINTEPSKCSGANVPFEWKKEADELKKR